MKPRTKLEKRIMAYEMPKLNEKEKEWLLQFPYYQGSQSHKTITCQECLTKTKVSYYYGQSKFLVDQIYFCPGCGKELKIEHVSNAFITCYLNKAFLHYIDEFVVLRFFRVHKYYGKERIPTFNILEVEQHWYSLKNRLVILSLSKNCFGNYTFDSKLSIKNLSRYNFYYLNDLPAEYLYPGYTVKSFLKQRGFNKKFYESKISNFVRRLINEWQIEVLLKNKAHLFLKYFFKKSSITPFFRQVQLAIKHKYIIKESELELWFDYLEMLKKLEKDLHSPKYLFPENIKEAHDKALKALNKKDAEYELSLIEDDIHIAYQTKMAKLKDLTIIEEREGLVYQILPLWTIKDVQQEGIIMDHCVFQSGYYKKKDSLLFTFLVNGTSMETIEVDKAKRSLLQHHGYDNKDTPFGPVLKEMVYKYMDAICNCFKKVSKKKKVFA